MAKRTYGGAPVWSYKRRAMGGGFYQGMTSAAPYSGYYKRRSVPGRYQGRLRRGGFYGRYSRGSQAARLRRGLHIEKKFFDTTLSFTFDATGEVPATGQLNLIPQGVTESTRVGRTAQIKSLQIRSLITYVPAADTLGVGTAYLYLVLDKQANGAAAAVTDVLTGTAMPLAMFNMANAERFKIIRKWTHTFQSGAGVSAAFGRDQWQLDDYVKLNLPIEYDSSAITGAITTIRSNNLFLLAGSDATTDDEIACAGTVRLRFTDI